jgi:hypothetical protein
MLALGADDTAQGSHRIVQLTPNENACSRLGVANKVVIDSKSPQVAGLRRILAQSVTGVRRWSRFCHSVCTERMAVSSRPLALKQNSVLFKGRLVLQQSGLPGQKQFGDPCGRPRDLRKLGAVGDESGLEL